MRSAVGILALAIIAALTVRSAEALTFNVEQTPQGTHYIVVKGDFEWADDLSLFEKSVRDAGSVLAVTFDSPGGNVAKAMALGRLIRQLGLTTIQFRTSQCASACSLAFLGGTQRYAEPGSIGVHKSSFAPEGSLTTEEAVSAIQSLTADILQYMSEMGAQPQLLTIALSYESNDIRYLSSSEMLSLGVVTDQMPVLASKNQPPISLEIPSLGPSLEPAFPSVPLPTPAPSHSGSPDTTVLSDEDLKHQAVTFVHGLVAAHSDNDEDSLAFIQRSYNDMVWYYGRRITSGEIMTDKRTYFRRWERRSYKWKEDTVSVVCSFFECVVTGEYDWAVESGKRHKRSSGTAQFTFSVENSSTGFRVSSETSKVVSRN